MDAKRKAEIRALCEAATPGPWHDVAVDLCGGWGQPNGKQLKIAPSGSLIQSVEHNDQEAVIMASNYDNSPWCLPEDRAFIAASRTAVPELLARVEELEAALGVLVDAVDLLHAANDRIMVDPHALEEARAALGEPKDCPTCHGTGEVVTRTGAGSVRDSGIVEVEDCPTCTKEGA